jgi:hypothetical protein
MTDAEKREDEALLLERNDVDGAVDWFRRWGNTVGREAEMVVQSQDDPAELLRRLRAEGLA